MLFSCLRKQCVNKRFEFDNIFCHFLQSCATAKTSILEMKGLWLLSIILRKSTPLPSQWHPNEGFHLPPSKHHTVISHQLGSIVCSRPVVHLRTRLLYRLPEAYMLSFHYLNSPIHIQSSDTELGVK